MAPPVTAVAPGSLADDVLKLHVHVTSIKETVDTEPIEARPEASQRSFNIEYAKLEEAKKQLEGVKAKCHTNAIQEAARAAGLHECVSTSVAHIPDLQATVKDAVVRALAHDRTIADALEKVCVLLEGLQCDAVAEVQRLIKRCRQSRKAVDDDAKARSATTVKACNAAGVAGGCGVGAGAAWLAAPFAVAETSAWAATVAALNPPAGIAMLVGGAVVLGGSQLYKATNGKSEADPKLKRANDADVEARKAAEMGQKLVLVLQGEADALAKHHDSFVGIFNLLAAGIAGPVDALDVQLVPTSTMRAQQRALICNELLRAQRSLEALVAAMAP